MSVLIKGMEMPKNCGFCRFAGMCGVHNDDEEWPDLESIMFNDVIGIDGVRDPGCPLIEVPEGVQPVKHGWWKWSEGGQCSECGFHNSNFGYDYCPNCGSKMDSEA